MSEQQEPASLVARRGTRRRLRHVSEQITAIEQGLNGLESQAGAIGDADLVAAPHVTPFDTALGKLRAALEEVKQAYTTLDQATADTGTYGVPAGQVTVQISSSAAAAAATQHTRGADLPVGQALWDQLPTQTLSTPRYPQGGDQVIGGQPEAPAPVEQLVTEQPVAERVVPDQPVAEQPAADAVAGEPVFQPAADAQTTVPATAPQRTRPVTRPRAEDTGGS